MIRTRSVVLALAIAVCGSMMAPPAEAEVVVVEGATAGWHSRNMELAKANLVPAKTTPLGQLAYDDHFLNTGRAPAWDFLSPLPAPDPRTARLEGGTVTFPASGRRVVLDPHTLPDVATPAAPFLLAVPAAETILVVEPYYLFQSKLTAYRVTAYKADGTPGPRFDSLPTHAMAGAPNILVAPERAGCCEDMTWSIRFYDLAAGTMNVLDCPPGRCGDLVLARADETGALLVAFEVFETAAGAGSVVETRLFVVAPDAALLAAGRLAHALQDSAVGTAPEWAACASRVLAAEGSPYAVAQLTAMRRLDDGRWAIRFDAESESSTWTIEGVSDEEVPEVVFSPASEARNES